MIGPPISTRPVSSINPTSANCKITNIRMSIRMIRADWARTLDAARSRAATNERWRPAQLGALLFVLSCIIACSTVDTAVSLI